jgi:hypothetical protein
MDVIASKIEYGRAFLRKNKRTKNKRIVHGSILLANWCLTP